MPWTEKQLRLFRAAAHDKGISKRSGIKQPDARRMMGEGLKKAKGGTVLQQAVGKADTKHGLLDLPVHARAPMKKSKMKFASGGSVRDRISMAIGDAVDRLRGTTYEPNPPQKEVRRAANIREVEDRAVSKKAGGVIRKRYADGGFVTDDDNPDDQYVDRGDRGPDLAAMAKATPAPAKPKPKASSQYYSAARKRGAEFGRENAASRDRSLGSSAQWRAGERGSKAMEDYKVLANAGDWAKKKGYKAGGVVRSRDGCAVRGKTKGRMV